MYNLYAYKYTPPPENANTTNFLFETEMQWCPKINTVRFRVCYS